MTLDLEIDGIPVRFSRHWFTGRATLSAGGQTDVAQSAWNPLTHVSLRLKRGWAWRIGKHELVIEKQRPLFLAGARPQTYRAYLDGELMLERLGY